MALKYFGRRRSFFFKLLLLIPTIWMFSMLLLNLPRMVGLQYCVSILLNEFSRKMMRNLLTTEIRMLQACKCSRFKGFFSIFFLLKTQINRFGPPVVVNPPSAEKNEQEVNFCYQIQ
jgi:hypothetical protein